MEAARLFVEAISKQTLEDLEIKVWDEYDRACELVVLDTGRPAR